MEHRVRYVFLGAFVFGLFLAGAWAILWQSKYAHNESFVYFKVQTAETVSGLNEKAPVKLLGVSVGEVSTLYINPNDSESVDIIVKVKAKTPIKEDTYAIIEPQGITGLSYLLLEGGTRGAKLLKVSNDKDDENMGTIFTKPSLLSKVDKSFESIVEKIELLLGSANKVLESSHSFVNENNMKYVEEILKDSAQATKSLANISKSLASKEKELDLITNNIIILEKEIIEAAKAVKNMSILGGDTMQSVSSSAKSVEQTMVLLSEKASEGMFDISSVAKDAALPLINSLYEMEILIGQLKSFIQNLENSPSDLLYKKSMQAPAPGEEL